MTARNLADIVKESAAQRPAHFAVVDGDRKITYAGLDDQVTATATGLVTHGVAHGDRVALLLGNHLPFVVALYAIVRAGAVAVPLNPSSTVAEIEHAVNQSGARAIICDSDSAETVRAAQVGSCVRIMAGSSQWDSLGRVSDAEILPTETDPESVAVLLFTSGSTGKPKAAILTHRALLANVEALLALSDPPAVTADDRTLAVLPLFHVYSLNAVLSLTLAAGATVVLSERFSVSGTLDLIEAHDVTVVAGAPPMYVAWSAEQNLRESLNSVRLLTSGAAPLPPALFDQIATMTGRPIWEGYGLTECSPVVTTTLMSGRPKAGSVGSALSNLEVRVISGGAAPREDEVTDDDETGEIWVRGPSLFSGYWPDRSHGPNGDGWFGTGDVGYFDDDHDLHLVDRRSDLILVSGFNVYPREVEDVLTMHEGIVEVAVTGVAHPYSGEAVKAFIVVSPGARVDADEILEFCRQRLARYKCPTILEVVLSLPHGVTGKLARGRLRDA